MEIAKNLVLGATGGIGRAVVKALLEKDEVPVILVRDKAKAEKYFGEYKDIEIITGDASNVDDVQKAALGCKSLFYCLNIPYPQWEEKAIPLLKTSLSVAMKSSLRFVFPGNVYIYGHAEENPVHEDHLKYPHTKKGGIRKKMEDILFENGERGKLEYTIVRMPDFYGPYVVNGLSEKVYTNALEGKKMQWIGAANVLIEYIFIEDAGKAMVIAGLSEEGKNQEFNVPAYEPVTSEKYLSTISRIAGKGSKFSFLNSDLVFTILGLFNPLIKEVKEMLYLKREELILDGSKFRKTFGYLPSTPLEDGIKKTLLWAKRFYSEEEERE